MLYVARHGETDYNIKGLVSGLVDAQLTERGYEQAQSLAVKVADATPQITKIIHSPLTRAKETARMVAEYNHLSMTPDRRLVELDFGTMDGLPGTDAAFRQARLKFAQRFPGGESYLDMYARVVPLVKECLADPDETYLLVCHQALIRCIHCYFSGLDNADFFDFFVDNAELYSYEQIGAVK